MSYSKTTWNTNDLITANKLNNIESGIESLDKITGAKRKVSLKDPDKIYLTYLASAGNNDIYFSAGTTYDFDVDWGDGQITHHTVGGAVSHNYAESGMYEISFTGANMPTSYVNGSPDARKYIEIHFSDLRGSIPANGFKGCTNLKKVYIPGSYGTIKTGAFSGCIWLKHIEFGGLSPDIEVDAFKNVILEYVITYQEYIEYDANLLITNLTNGGCKFANNCVIYWGSTSTPIKNLNKTTTIVDNYNNNKYLMDNTENLATILATYKTVELKYNQVYTFDNVVIPNGSRIIGNDAMVKPSSTANACFLFNLNNNDITIENIHFQGQATSPNNTAGVGTHTAIKATRSYRNTIKNCTFENFAGSAIVITGNPSDFGGVFTHANQIIDNRFRNNFCSGIFADRSEYSKFETNFIYGGAYGVIANSGNWEVNNNLFVACTCPYVSVAQTITIGGVAQTTFTSDNWNHGSLIGNTFNHCNNQNTWTTNRAITLGTDGSVSLNGIYVKGVLAPTFVANTLYYCDITSDNLLSEWVICGCVHSDGNITNNGAINKVYLLGVSGRGNSTISGNNIQHIKYADFLKVGDLSLLTTVDKSNIVNALNEVRSTSGSGIIGIQSIAPSLVTMGYNSQISGADPIAQGWTKISTSTGITDPNTVGFADFIIYNDSAISENVLLARDNATTLNPQLYKGITAQETQKLFNNGGIYKIVARPLSQPSSSATVLYNGLILFGYDAALNPGWTGATSTTSEGGYTVEMGFSNGDALAGTYILTLRLNLTASPVFTVGTFKTNEYVTVKVVSKPGNIPAKIYVNDVYVTDVTYNKYVTNYGNRICWAGGSTAGVNQGLLIKNMEFLLNGDNGNLTLASSNSKFNVNIFSKYPRDYTINIPDYAYNLGTELNINFDIPTGNKVTLNPLANTILLDGYNKPEIYTSAGTKQSIGFIQEVGATGKSFIKI